MDDRTAPSFPESVTLVCPDACLLVENADRVRAVFENMGRFSSIIQAEKLFEKVVVPHTIRSNVLSFHWDRRTETGYYIPFDMVPVIEFWSTMWTIVQDNGGVGFFRELHAQVEEKYSYHMGTFGGPVAFKNQYNPPLHLRKSGRITPLYIAVKNLFRRSEAPMANDSIFAEFQVAAAASSSLYHFLQWHGASDIIEEFMRFSYRAPERYQPEMATTSLVERAPAPEIPRWRRTSPPPPPAFSFGKTEEVEFHSSAAATSRRPKMDADEYLAMQSAQAQLLYEQQTGTIRFNYTVHFPDMDGPDRVFLGSRIQSLHSLEAYLRGQIYKDTFWAEVVVYDVKKRLMNHVTFVTAMREPNANFTVHMHRFLSLLTATRICVLGGDGEEQGATEVSFTHRTYAVLESQARTIGAARLCCPLIMAPERYLIDIVDTGVADDEQVDVTPDNYGLYVRDIGTVMHISFYPPQEAGPASSQDSGSKRAAAETPPSADRRRRRGED
jgi:hypothetical protein